MARLTGEAARKWLEENPNAAYTDNRTGQKVSRERGGLEKFGLGLIKPFRSAAGTTGEFLGTFGDLIRAAKGEWGDVGKGKAREIGDLALTEEEVEALRKNPELFGLKSAAGVLSYAVPGGGGAAKTAAGKIGTATLRGVGAGTLGGFGASREGDELMSTLKGAGLGGLIGGGLQAGGEALKALKGAKVDKGAGEGSKARQYLAKQRGEAIGLDPNKIAKSTRNSVSSSTEADKVIDDFFSIIDERGLSARTSNIASKSSDEALGYYSTEFGKLLGKADDSIMFTADDTLNVLDTVKGVVGNNRNIMKNSTVEELFNDMYNLGEVYKPSQLNLVREKAREMINWSRSSSKMPMTERGAKAIFDSIDDLFKTKIPVSETILSKMKTVYTVRPYIQAKAQLGDVMKLGTVSTNIEIPTFGIDEAIKSTVGKVAQGAPGGGASQGIAQGIGKVARPIAKGIQRVGPAMASQVIGGQAQPIQGVDQGLGQGELGQGGQGIGGQGGLQQDELQALNYYLANAILQGDISSSDASAVMEMLGIGGAGGGEMSGNQSKATALQASLDRLKQAWGGTGGGGKLMETLGLKIGSSARSLDQAKAAVAEDLGRLQSQGAINKEELTTFNSMMPNSWDPEDVVQQKFQAIQDRIDSYL